MIKHPKRFTAIYDPSPKNRYENKSFLDFLEFFTSVFGHGVKKSNILEVGFEFSMKSCIFSQLERSGGEKIGTETLKT